MFNFSFKQVSSVICALILTLTLCLGTVGHASAQGANAGGGGGSAGGGGGSAGGGGVTGCVSLTQLSNTVGYFSSYAAIWTKQSFTETCGGGGVTWRLDYRNSSTGSIEHSVSGLSRNSYNGTIDDDYAPFSTSYNLTLTVTDERGVVQLVQNTAATTPAPKVPGA